MVQASVACLDSFHHHTTTTRPTTSLNMSVTNINTTPTRRTIMPAPPPPTTNPNNDIMMSLLADVHDSTAASNNNSTCSSNPCNENHTTSTNNSNLDLRSSPVAPAHIISTYSNAIRTVVDNPNSTRCATENSSTQKTIPERYPPTATTNSIANSDQHRPIMCSSPTSFMHTQRPTRENVLRRLSEALLRKSLTKIDMSQRHLRPSDAKLIKLALLQNSKLRSLKLGYNNLYDEGIVVLAEALAEHSSLQSLDLGFCNMGDVGMEALAAAFLRRKEGTGTNASSLHTLYLAGNCIGVRGAIALSKMISSGCIRLKKLHLTGNTIGTEGVLALTRAIIISEKEQRQRLQTVGARPRGESVGSDSSNENTSVTDNKDSASSPGIQELFLGGTGKGSDACHAITEMINHTYSLRVLSLADCKLNDDDVSILARSIAKNRERLPLEAIQFSFNNLTCTGVESLMNAVWGSKTLRELRLDNNQIGDRGAQLVAVVVANVPTLERLDLGFNNLTATGMRALMKSVAESDYISSLSISGNKLDTGASKAVAYALAYNSSLKYFFMDNCCVNHASQRHITAGIVSNSGVSLHTLTGFQIGAVAVTLGLPSALEGWTNEQVLKFILLMWERMRHEQKEFSAQRELDPLSFLPDPESNGTKNSPRKPLDPATVVAVAKRAYASLGDDGGENKWLQIQEQQRKEGKLREPSLECPLVEDAVMLEADEGDPDKNSSGGINSMTQEEAEQIAAVVAENASIIIMDLSSMDPFGDGNNIAGSNGCRDNPHTTPPLHGNLRLNMTAKTPPRNPLAQSSQRMMDPARKRRNVDWLCHHIRHLHELSNLAFNPAELWRLHQHFFTPSVYASAAAVSQGGTGGCGMEVSMAPSAVSSTASSLDDASQNRSEDSMFPRGNSTTSAPCAISPLSFVSDLDPYQDAARRISNDRNSTRNSLPGMGRKVSYRALSDAIGVNSYEVKSTTSDRLKGRGRTISNVVEEGNMNGMQPRSKRARRNKTRISYFPRIKAKLDSFLEKSHQKAIVIMRQLYYVEQIFINNYMSAADRSESSYITKPLAHDIEVILLDMM